MIENFVLSEHAKIRMQQRGLKHRDIVIVLTHASQVAPDAYVLTDRDVDRVIKKNEYKIQRLDKLRRCKVIVRDSTVVTFCRQGKNRRRGKKRYRYRI